MRGGIEPCDQRFKPRAPLRERLVAQVLAILGEQIVGAEVRGEFGDAASH